MLLYFAISLVLLALSTAQQTLPPDVAHAFGVIDSNDDMAISAPELYPPFFALSLTITPFDFIAT